MTARNQRSNCWICEGWVEKTFEFRAKDQIDVATVPVPSADVSADLRTSRARDTRAHGGAPRRLVSLVLGTRSVRPANKTSSGRPPK